MSDLPARPEAASEEPRIHPFQLDGRSVGSIASSVNLFRGDVNLPLTLVKLEGRNDIALEVSALYASNVASSASTWNATAPTSVLGLGWTLSLNRIFIDGKTTGEPIDGVFYLQWNGVVDRLIWCGADGGDVLFQCRRQPLWQIRYTLSSETWRVVFETGSDALFGGADDARGLLTCGVRWDNWIGSTLAASPQPQRYVIAWNLAAIRSPWGDGLTYAYHADEQEIAGGVTYTRATFLASIEDMLGQRATFRYAQKEASEYVVPHQRSGGVADRAWQDRYETFFLEAVDITTPGSDEPEYTMEFHFTIANVSGHPGQELSKRLLKSVTQKRRGLLAAPPIDFEYELDATRPNPGALTKITFPEGGEVHYRYAAIELNRDTFAKNIPFAKNIDVASPIAGSRPLVFHGPSYIAIAWYSAAQATTRLQLFTFAGRWSEPWEIDIAGRIDPDGTRAAMQDEFFALFLFSSDSDRVKLRLFRRIADRFGDWRLDDLDTDFGNVEREETSLVSGNDFLVLHTGGSASIHRWTWDRGTDSWTHDTQMTATTRIAITAHLSYYAVAYYNDATRKANHQLFHRDLAGAWTAGAIIPAGAAFEWISQYAAIYWAAGANFAVAATVPDGASVPQMRILMWDETFALVHDRTYTGARLPVQVIDSTVASGSRLYRFDGASWQQTNVAVTDDTTYAFGSDVALFSRVSGSTVQSTLASYDPDSAGWNLETFPPSGRMPFAMAIPRRLRRRSGVAERAERRNATRSALQTFAPTISAGVLTVDDQIRWRTPSGEWRSIGVLPADAAKDSLVNRAPEYLVFENTPADPRQTKTTVVLFENGAIGTMFDLPQQRILTGDSLFTAAQLTGAKALVTYPAGESILSPTMLFLHRVFNHELSDVQTDFAVVSVAIDNGYETTTTTYDYDAAAAVFDTSGEVVQYPRVIQRFLDHAGKPSGGSCETLFHTGLPELGSDAAYTLLAGYPRSTRTSDAEGLELSEEKSEYATLVLLTGAESPLGVRVPATQVVLAKQTKIEWLELFSLPRSVAADFDGGTIPPSVHDTFEVRGVPLSSDASVSAIVAGTRWMILAGGDSYPVQLRDGELLVFGGLTTSTGYTYDDATALALGSRSVNYDSDGQPQTIATQTQYAWQLDAYRKLKETRMLTAVAEERTTNETAGVTMSATASTYGADWNAKNIWATNATHVWRGPSATAPPFDHRTGAANAEWLETTSILARNEQGQSRVTREALGPVISLLFDRSGYRQVASLSNVDLSKPEAEAGFLGFEEYEELHGWRTDDGTSIENLISDREAHTGVRSLRLPGGATGVTNTFHLTASKPMLFAAWVRTDSGYTSGASVTIAGEPLAIPTTGGNWTQIWKRVDVADVRGDVSVDVVITLRNDATSAVFVDDLRFTPLAGPVDIQVYDLENFFLDAQLTQSGATARFLTDPFGRRIVDLGPEEQVIAVYSQSYSRDAHARFDPAEPNVTLDILAAGGGFVDDFHGGTYERHWSAAEPTHWRVEGDALVHIGVAADAIALRQSQTFAGYGVRLELDMDDAMDDTVVTAPLGFRVTGSFTARWTNDPGEWQLLDAGGTVLARFPQSQLIAGACLLIIGEQSVHLFQNGRQILAHDFGTSQFAAGGVFELFASSAVRFGQIAVFHRPRVIANYLDGSSSVRQELSLASGGVVCNATVYDPMNRATIVTKKMLYARGRLGYKPGLVRGIDWESGVMTGELSDYYSGGEQSDDGGYPYQRDRLVSGPSEEIVERGLPGATLAIRPGNTHTTQRRLMANTKNGFLDALPALQYRIERSVDADGVARETLTDKRGNQIGARVVAQSGESRARVVCALDARGAYVKAFLPNHQQTADNAGTFVLTQEVDVLGNVLRTHSADEGTTENVFDDANRLRFTRDAKHLIVYHSYDVLGREIEKGVVDVPWDRDALQSRANGTWPAGESDSWTHRYHYDGDGTSIDQAGQLHRTELHDRDTTVVEQRAYDASGNTTLAAVDSGSDRYSVGYRYDLSRSVTAITYPRDAGEVHYAFDALGQVRSVGDANTSDRYAAIAYEASGSFQSITQRPGEAKPIRCTYRYNSPGWPTAIEGALFTERVAYYEEPGQDGAHYYSAQNARVSSKGPFSSDSWINGYDAEARLVSAEHSADPNASFAATYDSDGNILAVREGTESSTYAYANGTNRVIAIDEGTPFVYDDDGAVRSSGDGATFTYDPVTNLPYSVETAAGARTELAYAPSGGRRTKRMSTNGGTPSEWRYLRASNGKALVEELWNGSLARRVSYIHGPHGMLGFAIDGVQYSVLSDLRGSSRVVVGPDGEPVAAYDYRPFGGSLAEWGDAPELLRYRYIGQELDVESGLYDFRARLYAPGLHRFLRPDPAKSGFSPYVYAGDDPFGRIDPDGELGFLAMLAIVVIVSAVSSGIAYSIQNPGHEFDEGFWTSVGIGAAAGLAGGALGFAAGAGAVALTAGAATTFASASAVAGMSGFVGGLVGGAVGGAAGGAAATVVFNVAAGRQWDKNIAAGALTGAQIGAGAGAFTGSMAAQGIVAIRGAFSALPRIPRGVAAELLIRQNPIQSLLINIATLMRW